MFIHFTSLFFSYVKIHTMLKMCYLLMHDKKVINRQYCNYNALNNKIGYG